MKSPHGTSLAALRPLIPVLLSYVLSFVYIGIYWNNHHHMLHVTERVSGAILWANLHLLFWLSLIPFVTGWMGENHFAPAPTALYGAILLVAPLAMAMRGFLRLSSEAPAHASAALPGSLLESQHRSAARLCFRLAPRCPG